MNMLPPPPQIPTKSEDKIVAVEILDRTVTDEEAMLALERAGNLIIGPTTLKDLDAIGCNLKGAAVTRNQIGRAIVSQQRAEMVMREMYSRLMSEVEYETKKGTRKRKVSNSEAVKIAASIGYVMGKQTESLKAVVEMRAIVQGGGPTDEPPVLNRAFPVGSKVTAPGGTQIVAENVHIHNGKEAKPAAK